MSNYSRIDIALYPRQFAIYLTLFISLNKVYLNNAQCFILLLKKCASQNYMIATGKGFLLAVSLHQ